MNPDGPDGNYTHYHLTDHQFSTVALIDNAARLIERVSYDAYGQARHHWAADITGDGAVNTADQTAMSTAHRKSIGHADYNVDADVTRTGTVNNDDLEWTVIANFDGALPDGALSAHGNTVGYAGYIFNAEVPGGGGLYTVRYRHYDPILGRWLERDPLGYVDGLNLYEYVMGNSVNAFDPFGLSCWWNPFTWGAEDEEWEDMMRENERLRKNRIQDQVDNGTMTEEEADEFVKYMEDDLDAVVDALTVIRRTRKHTSSYQLC